MPTVGISITKEVAFRDAVQQFSNVYFYFSSGSVPGVSGADAMIDEVTTKEKAFHSTLVTFKFGRCWHETGSKATTQMISQKNLSGTGSSASDSGMDKERAFLIRWRAGVDSRGNPVYLRKFYHCCGAFASASGAITSTILANAGGFTQPVRDAIAAKANDVNTNTAGGGGWELVAKSGRQRTGGAGAEAHKYLEHHQLGDMWRG